MSKRKDRERAEKGKLFRGGKLVPKEEVEKQKKARIPAPEDTGKLSDAMERLLKLGK